MTGVKDRQARGRQENYTYTINLDWDGQVPSGNVKSPQGSSKAVQVPSGDSQVPSGGSNTTSNTPKKRTTSKTTTIAPVVADAPTVTMWDCSFPNSSLKEFHPSLTTNGYGLSFEEKKYGDTTFFLSLNSPSGLTSRDTEKVPQVPTRDLKDADDFWSEAAVAERLAGIGTGWKTKENTMDEEW
jgi:hypothetical protein